MCTKNSEHNFPRWEGPRCRPPCWRSGMNTWIDHSQRRTERLRADQLLSGFPLGLDATRLLGCPGFASSAMQPPAGLQLRSLASLRGWQPGESPAALEDRRDKASRASRELKDRSKRERLQKLISTRRRVNQKLEEQAKTQNIIKTQNITQYMWGDVLPLERWAGRFGTTDVLGDKRSIASRLNMVPRMLGKSGSSG